MENIKLPSVIIFGFLAGERCQQSVDCLVSEELKFDEMCFSLAGAVVAKPNHFLAVTKLGDKFYNMDNLDKSKGKTGWSTFKEAFITRSCNDSAELNIGTRLRSNDCQRAGALMNLVYVGEKEKVGVKFAEKHTDAEDLSKMLVIQTQASSLSVEPLSPSPPVVRVNNDQQDLRNDSCDSSSDQVIPLKYSPLGLPSAAWPVLGSSCASSRGLSTSGKCSPSHHKTQFRQSPLHPTSMPVVATISQSHITTSQPCPSLDVQDMAAFSPPTMCSTPKLQGKYIIHITLTLKLPGVRKDSNSMGVTGDNSARVFLW